MKAHPLAWRRMMGVAHELAPLAAVVVLLVAPLALPTTGPLSPEMIARTERIATAIDAAPWVVGRWTGRGVSVPLAAWEILRPSAILSRRYRAIYDGSADQVAALEVTFTVIHCNDMRDMNGHYPPVCYPAHGWLLDHVRAKAAFGSSTTLGGAMIMEYEFSRLAKPGEREAMRVLNFFIMPDGRLTPDMQALRSMARWRSTSQRGIVQVQLVCAGSVPGDEAMRALSELVDGMPELFGVLTGKDEEIDHGRT